MRREASHEEYPLASLAGDNGQHGAPGGTPNLEELVLNKVINMRVELPGLFDWAASSLRVLRLERS